MRWTRRTRSWRPNRAAAEMPGSAARHLPRSWCRREESVRHSLRVVERPKVRASATPERTEQKQKTKKQYRAQIKSTKEPILVLFAMRRAAICTAQNLKNCNLVAGRKMDEQGMDEARKLPSFSPINPPGKQAPRRARARARVIRPSTPGATAVRPRPNQISGQPIFLPENPLSGALWGKWSRDARAPWSQLARVAKNANRAGF